jgi:protein kinase A
MLVGPFACRIAASSLTSKQLDYCPGGEIFTYLRRAHKFNEYTSIFYSAEIVLIFEFLHDHKGVAYRDLKPENILIDAQGHLKLVDFGFAKSIGKSGSQSQHLSPAAVNDRAAETYTLCGTPEYLAPEVIRNTGHGTAVDWWAFGILLYEFLVGQPPFWDSNPMKIYSKIVEGKISYPSSMPPAAKDIIEQLCKVNPSERLGNIAGGTQKVKEHQWFKDVNWHDLYYRKVHGPIVPKIKGPTDSSCFDNYDPAPERASASQYTKEMEHQHEAQFKEF